MNFGDNPTCLFNKKPNVFEVERDENLFPHGCMSFLLNLQELMQLPSLCQTWEDRSLARVKRYVFFEKFAVFGQHSIFTKKDINHEKRINDVFNTDFLYQNIKILPDQNRFPFLNTTSRQWLCHRLIIVIVLVYFQNKFRLYVYNLYFKLVRFFPQIERFIVHHSQSLILLTKKTKVKTNHIVLKKWKEFFILFISQIAQTLGIAEKFSCNVQVVKVNFPTHYIVDTFKKNFRNNIQDKEMC